MANFTLTRPDVFPEGTSVKALKRSNYLQNQRPPGADVGAADSTVTVTNGAAAFTGLADGTGYYATATVNGAYRVIGFQTPPAVPATAYVGAQDFSGATLTLPSGLVIPRFAALAADVGPIQSQIVLQNITGLGLAIGASATEIWLVKYWLLVNAPNATMDVNLGFTVPGGCTMKWGGLPGNTSNTPGFGSVAVATPPLALLTETQTLQNGTPAAGSTGVGLVAMVYGGGTAGTVQIQYAQVTSNANPLKIDRGSTMEAVKVAS